MLGEFYSISDININTFIYQINFFAPYYFCPPDDFRDAFCVAGGVLGRPCNCTLTIALHGSIFVCHRVGSDGVKDTSLKAKAKTKDFAIVLEDPRGRGLVLEDSNTDSWTWN